MQKGQVRGDTRRRTEGGRDECRKVKRAETRGGMSAERSSTWRHAEGGRDECR